MQSNESSNELKEVLNKLEEAVQKGSLILFDDYFTTILGAKYRGNSVAVRSTPGRVAHRRLTLPF